MRLPSPGRPPCCRSPPAQRAPPRKQDRHPAPPRQTHINVSAFRTKRFSFLDRRLPAMSKELNLDMGPSTLRLAGSAGQPRPLSRSGAARHSQPTTGRNPCKEHSSFTNVRLRGFVARLRNVLTISRQHRIMLSSLFGRQIV